VLHVSTSSRVRWIPDCWLSIWPTNSLSAARPAHSASHPTHCSSTTYAPAPSEHDARAHPRPLCRSRAHARVGVRGARREGGAEERREEEGEDERGEEGREAG
jgi:hypothetical protein